MDLTQNKLSKREWETIEIPVTEAEKAILTLLLQGFHDVNIRHNETQTLFSYTKIEYTPEIEFFLYKKYFEANIGEIAKKYIKKMGDTTGNPIIEFTSPALFLKQGSAELKQMKSADAIRLQNLENMIQTNRTAIFEFLLIELCKDLLKQITKRNTKYSFYLYTLLQLKKSLIRNINQYVVLFVDAVIRHASTMTTLKDIIRNSYEFIEKNPYLFRYEDKTLFSHQKELFQICNRPGNRLVLYTAPTGTGKTLSPIGLSERYRIIFVCVARHIGLALAKSAISMEKKVAFAFGCETASDIRLHYFAAVEYTKHRKSGGIGKIDNSVGDNVEIMICDVQSYITAMHYMLAFNDASQIITYWDEPTITMDSEDHQLHTVIHDNWSKNQIPMMVLSCATLPNAVEIQPIFDDFREKFDGAEIHTITSYDCRKSIPIINKDGFCELPHYMYSQYADLVECVAHCEQNKTLLRYFDLREIVRFIEYVNTEEGCIPDAYGVDTYFNEDIAEITMNRLKEYYLALLTRIVPEKWTTIYSYMMANRQHKFTPIITKSKSMQMDTMSSEGKSLTRTSSVSVFTTPTHVQPEVDRVSAGYTLSNGTQITTKDAYTLTDGPTIFLADNVANIGKYYIQQTKIPSVIFQNILSKITSNNEINKRIDALEQQILLKEAKTTITGSKDMNASTRESGRLCKESQAMMTEITKLRKEIRMISLDTQYIPNTKPHQTLWTPNGEIHEDAFVANIGEDMVKTIMLLDVDNQLKILLLLGIGMFLETSSQTTQYMEIMKQLADEQRLFIIIASTDYIYGTNYQFCHGFIGKDLTTMTQQKTMQAMGRIGRNNIQQDYTIRFRDDEMIANLFRRPLVNLEAVNMCKLFCSA